MSSTTTAQRLTSRSDRRLVNFAPAATTATLATLDSVNNKKCLPIALFRNFLAGFMKSTGTGAVSEFRIIAATADDGTGNTAVVSHALALVPDQVGETVFLECNAEEIREALAGATHVGVEITFATGTDKATLLFERANPLYVTPGLTADTAA